MATTYAAFYLPTSEDNLIFPNRENAQSNFNTLWGALKNTNNDSGMEYSLLQGIADNLDIQGTTAFTQKYAAAAISDIINGEQVTSQMKLDSLFNTYAPALNLSLLQSGFNSLKEMKNAVKAGNVNVSNFIQGLSSGMSAVTDIMKTEELDNSYGEELPIDVVTKCELSFTEQVAQNTRKVEQKLADYISDFYPCRLTLTGRVKNENAELWSINEFSNKILDIMYSKEYFKVRIGKTIYDNCIFSEYYPAIENIYNLAIRAVILLDCRNAGKNSDSLIIDTCKSDLELYNETADDFYGGIYC